MEQDVVLEDQRLAQPSASACSTTAVIDASRPQAPAVAIALVLQRLLHERDPRGRGAVAQIEVAVAPDRRRRRRQQQRLRRIGPPGLGRRGRATVDRGEAAVADAQGVQLCRDHRHAVGATIEIDDHDAIEQIVEGAHGRTGAPAQRGRWRATINGPGDASLASLRHRAAERLPLLRRHVGGGGGGDPGGAWRRLQRRSGRSGGRKPHHSPAAQSAAARADRGGRLHLSAPARAGRGAPGAAPQSLRRRAAAVGERPPARRAAHGDRASSADRRRGRRLLRPGSGPAQCRGDPERQRGLGTGRAVGPPAAGRSRQPAVADQGRLAQRRRDRPLGHAARAAHGRAGDDRPPQPARSAQMAGDPRGDPPGLPGPSALGRAHPRRRALPAGAGRALPCQLEGRALRRRGTRAVPPLARLLRLPPSSELGGGVRLHHRRGHGQRPADLAAAAFRAAVPGRRHLHRARGRDGDRPAAGRRSGGLPPA